MGFAGLLGASGAGKAASTMKKALKFQKKVYADTKEDFQPFIEGGTEAFTSLASEDFRNREFYQFREEEANRALRRGLSFRGNLFSGAGLEAEARLNTQLTGEQIDREQNLLLSLAQIGQGSVAQLGSIGVGAGANMANTSAAIGRFQQSRGMLLGEGIDDFIGTAVGIGSSFYGGGGLPGAGAGTQVGSAAQGTLQAANAQRLFPIPGY